MDRHRRTLVKTLTWRFFAVLITWIVVYLYSRDVQESTVVAVIANVIKMAVYYLHERVWNNLSFGKR